MPQEDIVFENLTLKKMLYYTAKMKMPDNTSMQEIEDRIQEVLRLIELTEHQNTMIKNLSGGQKKRASIAVELLADPGMFFLDEPTSVLTRNGTKTDASLEPSFKNTGKNNRNGNPYYTKSGFM